MPKLGRKFCCKFKCNVKCLSLVSGYGQRFCFFDVTTEKQYYEKHELEHVFCPLLPESEKIKFYATLKEQGVSLVRRWLE